MQTNSTDQERTTVAQAARRATVARTETVAAWLAGVTQTATAD